MQLNWCRIIFKFEVPIDTVAPLIQLLDDLVKLKESFFVKKIPQKF